MSTTTVPQETLDAATLHLVSSEVMFGHLRRPRAIKFAPDGTLTIDLDEVDAHDQWCDFFAATRCEPITVGTNLFVHAYATWFGRCVWVDLFTPLAAAVAALPTDPGRTHTCTGPDCTFETDDAGPVDADTLLDEADSLIADAMVVVYGDDTRDCHVRLTPATLLRVDPAASFAMPRPTAGELADAMLAEASGGAE